MAEITEELLNGLAYKIDSLELTGDELREHVEMVQLRPGLFLVSWIDDEMGLLAQILDVETGSVLAAIPVEGTDRTEILQGTITQPEP